MRGLRTIKEAAVGEDGGDDEDGGRGATLELANNTTTRAKMGTCYGGIGGSWVR